MKYDVQLVFMMIAIGLMVRKLSWKGWFGVALLIIGWMSLNLVKGIHS